MYQRALASYEKSLDPGHTSTLRTVNNLGLLYKDQGRLEEAENMHQRALTGCQKALAPDHDRTRRLAETWNLLSVTDRK
ncbi:hypothetical protein N7471_010403 [Penicillium samsonianum]|uniref:uncharacterized protein n=1 Tax=Penicillium samsonianum TaxID=1882272 RepID=UPI002547777A|nr:uncharacterized protein N7471_010403 [Penicillium samsonianum]KAJ6125910.1 hypothetical protein N7471_010403 [Penicillium samsonianum]